MDDPRQASSQYGDFKGSSSADEQLDTGLSKLANDLNVSGFPVGFSFTRLNEAKQRDEATTDDEVYLSIFVADRDAGYGVDDVNKYIQKQGGTLLVPKQAFRWRRSWDDQRKTRNPPAIPGVSGVV